MARIAIAGATGTAGSAALQRAIEHADVSEILVLGRREPWLQSPKIQFIQHSDFHLPYPPSLVERLKGCRGVVWAMGLPAMGNSRAQWDLVHRTFALEGAKAFEKTGDSPTFIYISGAAIRRDRSWHWIAKAGAEIETELVNMTGINAVICRSPLIQPTTEKPKKHWADKMALCAGSIFQWLAPSVIIRADELAAVLVDIAVNGPAEGKGGKEEAGVYSSADLQAAAARLVSTRSSI